MAEQRTGGRVLVDQLALNGVTRVFGVPGESYLAVLDALVDVPSIEFTICRQEGGVAMMADAQGKMTGRPGIAFVTRGPGATNASAGVHIAFQDSTPMILFIGQVARETVERDAFQEIDYRQMFGPMCKWVAQIDDAARIPEFIHRAFATAMNGRPGPVVLALPEDMLTDVVAVPDGRPAQLTSPAPAPEAIKTLKANLDASSKPVIIAGGSGWDHASCAALERFAEAHAIPVAVGFRRQDLIDHAHPCYAGDIGIGANPKLLALLNEADHWLVLGSRLGEMTSGGYTRFGLPVPQVPMTHVLNGPEELGRVYQPEHLILASPDRFLQALEAEYGNSPAPAAERQAWRERARANFLDVAKPPAIPGDLQMAAVIDELNERLPKDAIIANGAGNYTAWPNRYYRYGGFRTQLAPTSGSMGYGLPAAVAAALLEPSRAVVCFAGDGCLMMTVQELATAVQYHAKVKILVVNNGMYGTIRMHQEREYPGRISGTPLSNPDFAAMARAFGAFGATVRQTAEFTGAFADAMAFDGPALIDLQVDPEAITPVTTIAKMRAAANQ